MPLTNNECLSEAQYLSAKESGISAVPQFHDIGMLEFNLRLQTPIISHALQTEMIIRGSEYFQNQEGPFHEPDKRSMPKHGLKAPCWKRRWGVNRSWLVYSPTKQAAYCFCCLLFSGSSQSSFVKPKGFTKWRKTDKAISHEGSRCHRNSFRTWKEAARRIHQHKRTNAALENISEEKDRWRNVLKRVID